MDETVHSIFTTQSLYIRDIFLHLTLDKSRQRALKINTCHVLIPRSLISFAVSVATKGKE